MNIYTSGLKTNCLQYRVARIRDFCLNLLNLLRVVPFYIFSLLYFLMFFQLSMTDILLACYMWGVCVSWHFICNSYQVLFLKVSMFCKLSNFMPGYHAGLSTEYMWYGNLHGTYMVHILKFCFLGILNFNFQHFYIFKIMSLPYLWLRYSVIANSVQ